MLMTSIGRRGWRAGLTALLLGTVLTSQHSVRAETLGQALAAAYESNPELLAARASLRARSYDIDKARSLWRPSAILNAETEQSAENGKSIFGKSQDQSRDWSASVNIFQPIFTGGRNAAERGEAEARVRAAGANLDGKTQSILVKTVVAFTEVAVNETVMDMVRADINTLRAIAKEQETLVAANRATASDTAQVQAAIEAARAVCLSNLADLQDSWQVYAQIIGRPPVMIQPEPGAAARANVCIDTVGERTRADLTLPVRFPKAPPSLDAAVQAAANNAPSVVEARADEDETRFGVSGSVADFMPSAGISVDLKARGQELNDPSIDRSAAVGASIRIPLYQSGVEYANLRSARERNAEARFLVEASRRGAATDVSTHWHKLVSVRVLRRVTRDQVASLERAFTGLRAEINAAKARGSTTDLLGLRSALLSARIALIGNARDEIVTIYRLLAAMGALSPEVAAVGSDETASAP